MMDVLSRMAELAYCVWQTFVVRHIHSLHYISTTDTIAGNLKSLNDLAQQARANYIIHTGDFGFYDEDSLKRIADK